jgi:hypothetical protein
MSQPKAWRGSSILAKEHHPMLKDALSCLPVIDVTQSSETAVYQLTTDSAINPDARKYMWPIMWLSSALF